MISWWWVGVAMAAPCDSEGQTTSELRSAADSVQRLLVEDLGAVVRARAAERALLDSVPCLVEPLTPQAAARILLARGLTDFFAGEPDAARPWLVVARATDPDLDLSPELAPYEAHPLAVLWSDARWDGSTERLSAPPEGLWFVNGRPGTTAPAQGPFLRQWVDATGAVQTSEVIESVDALRAEAPLVAVADGPAPSPAPSRAPTVVEREPRRFPTATVTGVVLLAGGATTAAVIGSQRSSLCNQPDLNSDGFADCGSGVVAGFWGGVGAGVLGAALTAVGIPTELLGHRAEIGPLGRRAWGARVRVRF